MSEQWIALLVTAGCVAVLIGWVPCLDWLSGYRPPTAERPPFQRTSRERPVVTDEEVRQLLRRKPFLSDPGKAPLSGMPHPVTFAPSERGSRTTQGDSL